MGLLGKLTKAGIAKQAIDLARRPENQRRAKELFRNLTNGRKQGARAQRGR